MMYELGSFVFFIIAVGLSCLTIMCLTDMASYGRRDE